MTSIDTYYVIETQWPTDIIWHEIESYIKSVHKAGRILSENITLYGEGDKVKHRIIERTVTNKIIKVV